MLEVVIFIKIKFIYMSLSDFEKCCMPHSIGVRYCAAYKLDRK